MHMGVDSIYNALICVLGDRVGRYMQEHVHGFIKLAEGFKDGDYPRALQIGFLTTDAAMFEGVSKVTGR